ncbi:coenzyme A biosynthesis bifunctional CoaBC domain protein [Mycobacterium xenopi 4042]|uniref:Coenzyme A biosynthesis bifunctional CoaBC domain protein n=1 Tax=Mycobacterium xenopi 4042 TaxID=1299334 RepID=X7YPL1_MYCXE|nr:coenzyme A biosynthesis bifunctional CoaBC domain protein [Mycobacterium xenopi 4042]
MHGRPSAHRSGPPGPGGPTESALRFIGAATFEALSGEPVHTGVFDDVPLVPHVHIGQEADLVVVAPRPPTCWLARWPAGPTIC